MTGRVAHVFRRAGRLVIPNRDPSFEKVGHPSTSRAAMPEAREVEPDWWRRTDKPELPV